MKYLVLFCIVALANASNEDSSKQKRGLLPSQGLELPLPDGHSSLSKGYLPPGPSNAYLPPVTHHTVSNAYLPPGPHNAYLPPSGSAEVHVSQAHVSAAHLGSSLGLAAGPSHLTSVHHGGPAISHQSIVSGPVSVGTASLAAPAPFIPSAPLAPVIHSVPQEIIQRVPVPVNRQVAVDRPVPVAVHVPHPVPVAVPVDHHVPVHYEVPRPVPIRTLVPVDHPVPVPIVKHIEIPRPYPVPVPVTHEKHVHVQPQILRIQRINNGGWNNNNGGSSWSSGLSSLLGRALGLGGGQKQQQQTTTTIIKHIDLTHHNHNAHWHPQSHGWAPSSW